MQTTALIRECLGVEPLVRIVDDYLCPTGAELIYRAELGHDEKSRHGHEQDVWNGICMGGHIHLVEAMIGRGMSNTRFDAGAFHASREGHLPVVKLMVEFGAKNLMDYMRNACVGGHLHVVRYLEGQFMDKRWNDWMGYACVGGHQDIVDFAIEHGANNWHACMVTACTSRHPAIADQMIARGANPVKCVCGGVKHKLSKG